MCRVVAVAKGSLRDPVRGVTTACAVWVSAALGVVAASGQPLLALYACGLTVTILRVSRWYNAIVRSRVGVIVQETLSTMPIVPLPLPGQSQNEKTNTWRWGSFFLR